MRVIRETLHHLTAQIFLLIGRLSLDAMSKMLSGGGGVVSSTTSVWWLSNSIVIASIVEQ